MILTVIRRGWMWWMFLHLRISGAGGLFAVHQPPVASAALGQDAFLPCRLGSSHHDRLLYPPVLYWERPSPPDGPKLWPPSEGYRGRVSRLDNSSDSSNMSIVLQRVQWEDGGKYLCKVSITPENEKSFRTKGSETLLLVYDNISVRPHNLTNHSDCRLQCEVNVTRGPGRVLSIVHNGRRLSTAAGGGGGSAHVTLSGSVSLTEAGEYECQLHVSDELLTRSVFHHRPLVTRCGGDAEGNATTPCPSVLSGLVLVSPEPWLLYAGLLLVPVAFLLGILVARCRR